MALGTPCDTNITEAARLMDEFAERTGLTSDRRQQRYLWTDAFAVCNFLGLVRSTGEQRHLELALQLVDQTHHTLGRHRNDDPRDSWISGLNASEGEAHPHPGRPSHRQGAARARPGRALRRAPRVGARRPVFPLSDQVDART